MFTAYGKILDDDNNMEHMVFLGIFSTLEKAKNRIINNHTKIGDLLSIFRIENSIELPLREQEYNGKNIYMFYGNKIIYFICSSQMDGAVTMFEGDALNIWN